MAAPASGRGVVEALARHGADVVIAEIDPDRAAQAAAAVERLGRRAVAVPTDVMDTDAGACRRRARRRGVRPASTSS